MRLIDADNLKEHSFALDDDIHFSCDVVDTDDIDNAPTIDAEPVVHAHWIEEDFGSSTLYHCSKCHAECWGGGYYCHNCGAKMDEVTEDD